MFNSYNSFRNTDGLRQLLVLDSNRTVNQIFGEFHESINIHGDHRNTCSSRRDSIVNHLKNDFHIREAFASGSVPKYTGLRGASDLDVIVVLHYGKHCKNRFPSEVLQQVRDVLSDYKTGSRKNGQAVTLYYDTWPNVDIVPAFRTVGTDQNVLYFNIPDLNTETWIKSNPKIHAAALRDRAATYGGEFRQLIKMVKWWNRQHSSYLQSYHIEVLALQSLTGAFTDFSLELWWFFYNACQSIESSIYGSPLVYLDSCVDDYLSFSDSLEILKRLRTARDTSLAAWSAATELIPNHQRAIELWRKMFGAKFPSY